MCRKSDTNTTATTTIFSEVKVISLPDLKGKECLDQLDLFISKLSHELCQLLFQEHVIKSVIDALRTEE